MALSRARACVCANDTCLPISLSVAPEPPACTRSQSSASSDTRVESMRISGKGSSAIQNSVKHAHQLRVTKRSEPTRRALGLSTNNRSSQTRLTETEKSDQYAHRQTKHSTYRKGKISNYHAHRQPKHPTHNSSQKGKNEPLSRPKADQASKSSNRGLTEDIPRRRLAGHVLARGRVHLHLFRLLARVEGLR